MKVTKVYYAKNVIFLMDGLKHKVVNVKSANQKRDLL